MRSTLLGGCKQKQRGLRWLLCRWPSITKWEMHITAQGPEMTYTVSSGTLNSTTSYPAEGYDIVEWNFVRALVFQKN